MRRLAALAACACIAAAQLAQQDEVRVSAHVYTPPQLRLTAQAQLVQLEVVVRDSHGQPVAGLKQGDFDVLDEGKPRAIAAFSVETRGHAPPTSEVSPASASAIKATIGAPPRPPAPPAPRSTLLFFDDLHASGGELQRTQAAAKLFIQDGLGPGVRAGGLCSVRRPDARFHDGRERAYRRYRQAAHPPAHVREWIAAVPAHHRRIRLT